MKKKTKPTDKVIIKSKIRKGETGTLDGTTAQTPIGLLYKINFENGQSGLYSEKDFDYVTTKKTKKTKPKISKDGNWKIYPKETPMAEVIDDMNESLNEDRYLEEGFDDLGNKEIEDKKENKETRARETKGKEPKVIPDFTEEIEVSTSVRTNPNGANQYMLDPRQALFWKLYNDPKAVNFGNAYQTAVEVGYSETSATQITTQLWFLEKTRRMNLLLKAEKVMEKTLETKHIKKKIGMFGPIVDPTTKEYVYEVDVSTLAIKNKVAMFVAERQGKDVGYSTRNELTGKDGKDLPTPILGGLPKEEINPAPEIKEIEAPKVEEAIPQEEIPTPTESILNGIIPEN